jgi:hypothetical protein
MVNLASDFSLVGKFVSPIFRPAKRPKPRRS